MFGGGGDVIARPLALIPRRCVALRPLRDPLSSLSSWARRAWLGELQGGQLPDGTKAEIKTMYDSAMRKQRRHKIAAERVRSASPTLHLDVP